MKFDRKKPFNELPPLPAKVNLDDVEILLETINAERAIAQLRTRLTLSKRSVANTLDLLSPLFVPEAVSSSGVENIITTNDSIYTARIKEERELSPVEKETLNYTDALLAGSKMIFERGILTTNDYLKIQSELEPTKNGIRKLPGTKLANPITGEVYYTPPEGERLIRDKLANFEQYFNEKAPMAEIYARMAILHYQFEAIHPFHDGNGRTGRILMPLYLTLQGELPVPVLFISRHILQNHDEYYKRLRAVTEKNAWKDWILFIIRGTADQANYTTKILDEIQNNIAKVKALLQEKNKKIYSSELIDFLFSHAYFTIKEFEQELDISPPTAVKYLNYLEAEGIVTKRKQTGRNRLLYINPHYTNILLKA